MHIALKLKKQPGFILVEGILALGLITAAVIFELTIFQQYQENQQRLLAVNQRAITQQIHALANWQRYLNQVAEREEVGKYEA
ncbi:hypothetical protein FPFC_013560 [Fructobacillus pseudoficulneus]|uniref:Uncharacterized protein n=1 Tax=Fructobacillus pseudoficulneus TaxID=220714 RepID=A0A3F3H7R8_9LACO|nr:type II secretion system protein [Fructobacillus pseudoficulneus]GAP02473.1 hypothetical protein FPFC_013560 [Fructobacillus pseudoficulneus]SEH37127.1 hypothetical protein SAMN05660469_0428 [Fructobacillus pseudoficulneus]